MSSARAAFGTLLKIGDGGGTEVFTTIAEVKDISGPSISVETIEVTNHDSSGARKEFIVSLIEMGEVSFDLNFYAGTTQGFSGGLYNDMINRTLRNFQLVIPTSPAKTGAFAAFIISWKLSAPVGDVLSVAATLKITGAVTWT